MIPCAYYNENNEFAAVWLNELIAAKLIPEGVVDTRSIWDVTPKDLDGFTQHHFFAGIGGWAYALRLAEWPDDRPIWTGSCPCQPFSSAGKGGGFADERHLWPAWFHLIRECRPHIIAGEQVEAAINHGWLDLVQADLEGEGYACGFTGVPAAGIGAPHLRQRLWFVADSKLGTAKRYRQSLARETGQNQNREKERQRVRVNTRNGSTVSTLANNNNNRLQRDTDTNLPGTQRNHQGRATGCGGGVSISQVADPNGPREQPPVQRFQLRWLAENHFEAIGREPLSGPWSGADWLGCADHKLRPVEPGTFPLAHGVPARVGRLRGYGNAIVPQVAAEVLKAYMSLG